MIITGLQKLLAPRSKKKEIYSTYRNNKDNFTIKYHYKKYCTILTRVIIEVKKLSFNNQIITASNNVKTAWKIINNNSGNSQSYDTVTKINSDKRVC
jgi:peptide methionine sulfoxide reductase MsrA